MEKDRQIDQITALIASGIPNVAAPAATPEPTTAPAAPAAPTASVASTDRANEIRSVVARCFS